jgi:hypothetical protein
MWNVGSAKLSILQSCLCKCNRDESLRPIASGVGVN